MSDTLPSSCPKRLFFLCFSLFVFFIHPSFGNNDPHLPRAVSQQMLQLREFIAGYAQNFVGIEYVHGGGSTAKGFDCSGFTSFALKEFGINVSAASSAQAAEGEEISLDAVLPGDLIFFGRRGRVAHVAMVVRNTTEGIICVHSTSSKGVMVENISASKYWRPKIMFARDVITRQAMENHLLPSDAQREQIIIASLPPMEAEYEMTPECAEEFEQTCGRIAPIAPLNLPDLQGQFQYALAGRRVK